MKLTIFLTAALSFAAYAGDKGGNGGGAHVCPGSIELYDFYEGKHPLLHNIPVWEVDPTKTVNDYLELALERLGKDRPAIIPRLRQRLGELTAIPYDQLVRPIRIPRLMDADVPFVDEDCDYVQVANWNERFDTVFFSKRLFESMDNMNKAGLYLHEVLYKAGRDLTSGRLQDSNLVRKLVAKVFSDLPITDEDIASITPLSAHWTIPSSGQCTIEFKGRLERSTGERMTSGFSMHVGLSILPNPGWLSVGESLEVPCSELSLIKSPIVWLESANAPARAVPVVEVWLNGRMVDTHKTTPIPTGGYRRTYFTAFVYPGL